MLTPIEIGNKIAEARRSKNLSQAALAGQLSLSPQAVGKWERGESLPDILTLDRLARILDIDLNYFSENEAREAREPFSADEHPALPPVRELPIPPASEQSGKSPGWNMSAGSWADADFSGLEGLHEKFGSSHIRRCLFVGSQLSGLLLKSNHVEQCDFSDASLAGSRIRNSNLVHNEFPNASLQKAVVSDSHIKNCDFSGADFTEADIRSSYFQKCTMTGTIWSRTRFGATHFDGIVLEGNFDGCAFENCGFTRTTFQNATFTRTFFKGKSLKKVRFVDCKADRLTYAFLQNAGADMNQIELIAP
ncbi:pentapeptide repeat-containing protein [Saccharibacillus sp. CPCC 101409]|uniref:helix-turn-helix domain-containing protein n=1 Tax=Saccharibacillus sp. CPCC 101409 TaxID=3058041 RepID=UPI002670E76E|nr:pentapeptide repeat-containing protein [Saccharibacillus sp. CPCC 101409]MDO3411230.1 pentapeptide repeat-containing protein [Saccharibacillus sp. CPCC 101409]